MLRKFGVIILVVLGLALMTSLAYAQQGDEEVRGSIRGTVREDRNGDGKCADEPVVAGIPLEFVSNDGKTIVYLQSGSNGTYGLVAAGLGTWKVSARPPAEYVVTSKKTVEAFLGEQQRLVLSVDFCVRKTTAAKKVLPESGAAASPGLLAAALLGAAFVAGGAGLEWRRRRG